MVEIDENLQSLVWCIADNKVSLPFTALITLQTRKLSASHPGLNELLSFQCSHEQREVLIVWKQIGVQGSLINELAIIKMR